MMGLIFVAVEKDRFIQKISGSIDSFPLEFQKYKILPELISALEFGGARYLYH
jgi:SCY1-like protein 1